MNSTFMLYLNGPLMSFASTSFGQVRESGAFPSRSAIIGILAGALGVKRGDSKMVDLHSNTRIHSAMIRKGGRLVDYQTVLTAGYAEYDPAKIQRLGAKGNPTLTWRAYQVGSYYLSAIETDNSELSEEYQEALSKPTFVNYLGRRSCPPAIPLLPIKTNATNPLAALVDEIRLSANKSTTNRINPFLNPLSNRDLKVVSQEGVYVSIDGEPERLKGLAVPEEVDVKLISRQTRRDFLSAPPRSFVSRSELSVHCTGLLQQEKNVDSNPDTTEEFFNASP